MIEDRDRIARVLADVGAELERAVSRFRAFNSAHEGYAVILEELDELWEGIKGNYNTADWRAEAVQIAAMAVRFICDICPSDEAVGTVGSKVHALKTWPAMFAQVLDGSKPFEYRRNDRNFKVGDTLRLREFRPTGSVGNTDADAVYTGEHTGRSVDVKVTSIVHGGQFGLPGGYCVMGIRVIGASE